MPQLRILSAFAAADSETGFLIHIIDDAGEVFEIEASRENVERMVQNLQAVLVGGAAENSRAEDRESAGA